MRNLEDFRRIYREYWNNCINCRPDHPDCSACRALFFREEDEGKEIELLYCTIGQLPDECRKIFLMASLDDMKYREIADVLNISVNTVKTQMKIALRFLREKLTLGTFSSILLFLSTGE